MSTSQTILAWIFWLCLGGIAYGYGFYAALIRLASACWGRVHQPQAPLEGDLPEVSLLVCAHDEQDVIARRIANALESDYPADKLEIAIASDGSTDQTCAIVRSYADRGVRLIEYPLNRGKATALNETIPLLRGSVVVLSDANTFFDPPSIRRLVGWLADPGIVAVCGRLLLTDPQTGKNVDSLYWRYETFLKRCEGKLGALLGSNGAIYAIRREQFIPIPAATNIDDFVIPLVARLRHGGSIVHDPQATARELTPPDLTSEFVRRARIGGGGIQSMSDLWPLLNPARGWIALTFFSHKILRWLCPLMMIAMFAANLALLNRPLYRWTMALQVLFYLCSAVSVILPAGMRLAKPLRLAAMFTGMNAALLVGVIRWLLGNHQGTWRRTSRHAETPVELS